MSILPTQHPCLIRPPKRDRPRLSALALSTPHRMRQWHTRTSLYDYRTIQSTIITNFFVPRFCPSVTSANKKASGKGQRKNGPPTCSYPLPPTLLPLAFYLRPAGCGVLALFHFQNGVVLSVRIQFGPLIVGVLLPLAVHDQPVPIDAVRQLHLGLPDARFADPLHGGRRRLPVVEVTGDRDGLGPRIERHEDHRILHLADAVVFGELGVELTGGLDDGFGQRLETGPRRGRR